MTNLLLQCVKEGTETILMQRVLTVSNVALSKGGVDMSTDFFATFTAVSRMKNWLKNQRIRFANANSTQIQKLVFREAATKFWKAGV